MLYSVEERSKPNEQSRESDPDRILARRLFPIGARQRYRESAAAKGEFSQCQSPEKSVVRLRDSSGYVHCKYEYEECHPDESCGQACQHANCNCDRSAQETETDQVNPKRMRGNPVWDEGRDVGGKREMLGGKNRHGNGKKQAAKRHELVDAVL